jgi:hypothetical protein
VDESISKVIKDLRTKQRELKEKVERIEATILSLQEVFGGQMVLPAAGSITQTNPPASKGSYAGMPIGQASIRLLKSAGAPKKTREIADALEQGGLHSSDMYRAVYNALDSNEEAEMLEGKRWGLKEWQV